jgi:urease accessory protein
VLSTDQTHATGLLELGFTRQGEATLLAHQHQRAPLMVQRPFYPEQPGCCHVVTLHNGGGIVAGDRLTLSVHLAANCHALVTSASAGKVYRSEGPGAVQETRLHLDPGAVLEWLPQETILFEASRFRQHTRVELAEGAHLLCWEITRFGRSARGERFTTGTARSHLEVWRGNEPLWLDRQVFEGSEPNWQSPHGLAGKPVVGSLCYLGSPVPMDLQEAARSGITALGLTGEAGVSRLPHGLLCRYRGESSHEAREWFSLVWRLLRARLEISKPARPRVWPACPVALRAPDNPW